MSEARRQLLPLRLKPQVTSGQPLLDTFPSILGNQSLSQGSLPGLPGTTLSIPLDLVI